MAEGMVEVPVLVGPDGQVSALPACAAIPGVDPGFLLESPALEPGPAEVAAATAVSIAEPSGPGRHDVAVVMSSDPGATATITAAVADVPASAVLDGWALAEELLGISLRGTAAQVPEWFGAVAPTPTGHAIEARVRAADAPEDALLEHLRSPQGPGVRVVARAEAGVPIGSGVALSVVAHGRDRATALTRLRQALMDCAVVVEGAWTNRSALIAALTAEITGVPTPESAEPNPVAVLVSAVRASDSERETQRAAFHARAARGRPEPADAAGVATTLSYDGHQYALQVFQTGRGPSGSTPGTPSPSSRSPGTTTSSGT